MIPPKQPLQPDDPRVNPELYRLVQEEVGRIALEERANFNPIRRPALLIKQLLREAREKVIADYNAEKEKKDAVPDSR